MAHTAIDEFRQFQYSINFQIFYNLEEKEDERSEN